MLPAQTWYVVALRDVVADPHQRVRAARTRHNRFPENST